VIASAIPEIANPTGVDSEVVSDTRQQAGLVLAISTKSGKAASFSGKSVAPTGSIPTNFITPQGLILRV
jgi:hypothetical protein